MGVIIERTGGHLGPLATQPGQIGKILRFGIFELDSSATQLSKGGRRVRLQDQPARVLLHLVERRGEVVTREQLRQELWPEDTFVDFDHGLNTAVSKIRDALGDSATSPRFVETVPKKGYRFIAPVEEAIVPVVPKESAVLFRAAAGVLVAAAMAGGWLMMERTGKAPELVASPLTSLPGTELGATLSPDGERVAFCWSGQGFDGYDIYVKQMGSERLLRITTDPAADVGPAWSPDGRWIAFARSQGGTQFGLYLVPSMGGEERQITVFHMNGENPKTRMISWLPGSEGMVFPDLAAPGKPYSLHVVWVKTGERRVLTTTPSDSEGDREPAVSPDGQTVAFVRKNERGTDLYLLRLAADRKAAGEPLLLLSDRHTVGNPAWSGDGKEIFFEYGPAHLPQLRRMNVEEKRPHRMEFAGQFVRMPAISSRGNRLTYTRMVADISIAMYQTGGESGKGPVTWRGSSSYLDHVPRYSPDGRRVAFISNRSGVSSLWVCNADGSGAVRLPLTDRDITNFGWSPDGNTLVATDGSIGYLVDSQSGTFRQVATPVEEVSRDGKWLYFHSRQTGRREIHRMPIEGGDAVQVTRKGGRGPQESMDGKFLYYAKEGGGFSLWRARAGGGAEQRIIAALNNPMSYEVAADGIYFIPPADLAGRSAIRFLRFSSGKEETLTELDKAVMWGFSVSPGGGTILFAQVDLFNSDLMVVENFQ